MLSWFTQLDDLLRGKKTAPDLLADGKIDLSIRSFIPLAVLLAMVYGFFMGWYAVLGHEEANYLQLLASAVKLPALFLLTLLVTAPSLYVFSALAGGHLNVKPTMRLLVGAIVVNVAVAASLGPILGFFSLSTESYPFMVILNVLLLAIAGIVGLGFLLRTLRGLAAASLKLETPSPQSTGPAAVSVGLSTDAAITPTVTPSPPARTATAQAALIFKIWVLIYSLVGAQMGWLLRPFIGSPDMPFSWFRQRDGNFFQSVISHLQKLLDLG
jgi:hypothetical protein